MQPTPLTSILAPHQKITISPPTFWGQIGIKKCYCILITGRCGSTLLTKLISSINAFGQPDEFFTEEMLPYLVARYKTSIFSEILPALVEDSSPGRTFGFQIDPMRLSWIQPYWDLATAFQESWISLIVMKRYDLISQAFSYLISKKSGRWHIFSSNSDEDNTCTPDSFLANYGPSDLDLIGQELLKELLLILRSERSIQNLLDETGISPLTITYEELLADRHYVMFKLFRSLGADQAAMDSLQAQKMSLSKNPTLKNPYDFKEILIERLFVSYPDLMNAINSERYSLIPCIESIIRP